MDSIVVSPMFVHFGIICDASAHGKVCPLDTGCVCMDPDRESAQTASQLAHEWLILGDAYTRLH